MNINITLCFQVINFSFTCLFLKQILFKPMVKIILEQEKKEAEIDYAIADKEAGIAQVYHTKQLEWQNFRKYCSFNFPITDTKEISPPIIREISDIIVCKKDVEAMASEVADSIVDILKNKAKT